MHFTSNKPAKTVLYAEATKDVVQLLPVARVVDVATRALDVPGGEFPPVLNSVSPQPNAYTRAVGVGSEWAS